METWKSNIWKVVVKHERCTEIQPGNSPADKGLSAGKRTNSCRCLNMQRNLVPLNWWRSQQFGDNGGGKESQKPLCPEESGGERPADRVIVIRIPNQGKRCFNEHRFSYEIIIVLWLEYVTIPGLLPEGFFTNFTNV